MVKRFAQSLSAGEGGRDDSGPAVWGLSLRERHLSFGKTAKGQDFIRDVPPGQSSLLAEPLSSRPHSPDYQESLLAPFLKVRLPAVRQMIPVELTAN